MAYEGDISPQLQDKIYTSLNEVTQIPIDTLKAVDKFDELALDSLDIIEATMQLEMDLAMDLPDEVLEGVTTVSTLIERIQDLLITKHS